MKFSKTYMIYPVNKSLEKAIEHYITLVSDEAASAAKPDNNVTVMDNFTHTRGNFEQQRYSSSVFSSAIDVLQGALNEGALNDELRKQAPLDWARLQNRLQNSLGNVLAATGQQQSDESFYRRAIAAFNSALEEVSQEESPDEWAATLYNLGTASQALGRLLEDAKLLNSAVEAYTSALLVWSREKYAEDWMFTMHQLGASFHAYGKLLKGNRTFQKSVVAYKNALAALDADNYALELTATHNNRAGVLFHLGESEENPDRLAEAVKSYEKALAVCMEQQLPFHLAVIIRVNKATAQNVLAELKNDTRLADEMADEFELILECFPHALQPLTVKHCEEQLKKAKSLA